MNPNPVDAYLRTLVEVDGSDLHVHSDSLPRLRSRGRLMRHAEEDQLRPPSATEVRALILATMPATLHAHWERAHEVDYSYEAAGIGRYRVNAFFDASGPAAVFRRVTSPPEAMDDIGLPPVVQACVDSRSGLLLIVGATGAGKSTTMAAMLNELNGRHRAKILTIEEPVEFAYPRNGAGLVSQREVGIDTPSFAAAAKAGLRQDPDVIGIGEIRDLDTLLQAIGLAESGHMVVTTGHGSSVQAGIARLVGLFGAGREEAGRRQLAGVLRAVVAQTLVPRATSTGRIAAFEVLLRTASTINKIREGNLVSLRSDMHDRASGMTTLERSLAELVVRAEVSEADAIRLANDPGQVIAALAALGGEPSGTG